MDLDALLQQMMQGPTEEQKRQARAQALAAAGFGILGAQGGSGWPGAVRALGRGGLLGMNVYNNELANQSQAPMQNLEMLSKVMGLKAQQQSMDDQQKMRDLASSSMIPGAPGAPEMGPPTAQGQMQPAVPPSPPSFDWAKYSTGLAGIDPVKALQMQQLMAKESPLDKAKPENYTPQSLARFAQTKNYADLVPAEKPKDAWVDIGRTPEGQFLQRNSVTGELRAVGSPGTRVTVNNAAETEENKAVGKARGESYAGIIKAGMDSGQRIAKLDAMTNLLGGVDTNSVTPIGMKVSGYARAAGLNLDPNLPQKQAAEAISNELTLAARSTAGGGGMPGAMSDADREFLKNSVPNLSQTPQGRATLIEINRRMAKRDAEIAALARQYRARTGTFDEGFQEILSKYANERPLFADLQQSAQGKTVIKFDAHGNPVK